MRPRRPTSVSRGSWWPGRGSTAFIARYRSSPDGLFGARSPRMPLGVFLRVGSDPRMRLSDTAKRPRMPRPCAIATAVLPLIARQLRQPCSSTPDPLGRLGYDLEVWLESTPKNKCTPVPTAPHPSSASGERPGHRRCARSPARRVTLTVPFRARAVWLPPWSVSCG